MGVLATGVAVESTWNGMVAADAVSFARVAADGVMLTFHAARDSDVIHVRTDAGRVGFIQTHGDRLEDILMRGFFTQAQEVELVAVYECRQLVRWLL